MTMSMAREFAPRGVTVNSIAPGFIESDMTKELPESIVESVRAHQDDDATTMPPTPKPHNHRPNYDR